jgi:hypothetical protein
MPGSDTLEFVIIGLTRSGQRFRPSDWAERLAGVMAQFGGEPPIRYSPYVYPVDSDGVKCVVVDVRIREIEPLAYHFLVNSRSTTSCRCGKGVRRSARASPPPPRHRRRAPAGPGLAPVVPPHIEKAAYRAAS